MSVFFTILNIYVCLYLCIYIYVLFFNISIAYRFLVMLRDLILYTYLSCSFICSRFFLCIRFAASFRFRLGFAFIGCGGIASSCSCFCSFGGFSGCSRFSFSIGCSFGFSCGDQRAGLGICKAKFTYKFIECCSGDNVRYCLVFVKFF